MDAEGVIGEAMQAFQVKEKLDAKNYSYQLDEATQTLSLEDTTGIVIKITPIN